MCSRTGFKEWLYLRRPGDAYAALPSCRPAVSWPATGSPDRLVERRRRRAVAVATKGRGRPAGFAGPDFRAAVAFYPGSCSEQRMGADWTTAIPLLVLIGRKDVWTPAEPCKELVESAARAARRSTFHAYPDA